MTDFGTTPDDLTRPSMLRRVRAFVWRCSRRFLLLPLAYAGLCLIGLFPVNNDFLQDPDGIEVLFVSNPVHSEIVMPLVAAGYDWREGIPVGAFKGEVNQATHVSIGWGDRGFFIETPQWSDLKVSTATNALMWPSSTCIHVSMIERNWLGDEAVSVRLSRENYLQLVDAIADSILIGDDRKFVLIPDESYGSGDAFFESNGKYHLFNTCNCWVGRMMKRSGVRVGWFTPLPKSIFVWLPANEDESNPD